MASDVTVITCTIPERETMLEECKASVAAQTHPPADHLIFRDTWHKGIQVGLNRLWPKVETEWLQWLADDDLLLPHHLEALEPYMPDADIIHSYCEVTGRSDGWLPNWSVEESDYFMTATALIRTSLVRELNGWHRHHYPEDHFFWRKAGAHGARFAVHREPTWVYRFHGENASFKPHRYVGP
jgi:glycosyltransferase involved in cell wall biosynthesis